MLSVPPIAPRLDAHPSHPLDVWHPARSKVEYSTIMGK
jgi:hypothetical protein